LCPERGPRTGESPDGRMKLSPAEKEWSPRRRGGRGCRHMELEGCRWKGLSRCTATEVVVFRMKGYTFIKRFFQGRFARGWRTWKTEVRWWCVPPLRGHRLPKPRGNY